jgi:hypothetical protein
MTRLPGILGTLLEFDTPKPWIMTNGVEDQSEARQLDRNQLDLLDQNTATALLYVHPNCKLEDL